MARDRSSSSPPFTTPLQALVANDTSTALFNPMTPPMDTTGINKVRVNYWLDAAVAIRVETAVQFSNDGVNWPDAAVAIGSAYLTTEGWVLDTVWKSINDDLAGCKLWCRFGLLTQTTSGTDTGSALASLSIDIRRVPHRTVNVALTRVASDGTTTAIFAPLTAAIAVEQFKEYRATAELGVNTGSIQIQPAYQVSDNPEEWAGWGTATAFGTNVTAEGMSFGTTFSSVTFTGSFVRFGFLVKNPSAGVAELARGALRVDLRACAS